jgi:hypothetical protein
MSILTPAQLIKQRSNRAFSIADVEFGDVDSDRPFMPEQYTQLYHTELYGELSAPQRLRYNQLFGARANEQFMLFESGFTNAVMANLLCLKMIREKRLLSECLTILLEEEKNHFNMFMNLNVKCMPELYQVKRYHFIKLSWFERALLTLSCKYPQHLISLLWLVLLMEEHAVRFSKDVVKRVQTDTLGELEPNFVLAHKMHLKDEAGHVHIDANVIEFVLEQSSPRKKQVNVKLLKRLLQATLRPKHAGINVVRQLTRERPELDKLSKHLVDAIRGFTLDPCMMPMFEDRSNIPVTVALLQLYPEFEQSLLF